jgi:hypothetical protein
MWLRTGLVFQARFLSLFLSKSQVWRLKFWTVLGELCSCSGMGWFVHYSGSKEDTQISATMHWTSMFWKDVGTRRHCYGREMMSAVRNASPMMICLNKLVRCVKTSMLQWKNIWEVIIMSIIVICSWALLAVMEKNTPVFFAKHIAIYLRLWVWCWNQSEVRLFLMAQTFLLSAR